MSRYGIKEVFNTLQGEGSRVGARSVFVRFSGCNLWDGNPLHRGEGAGACARWCDTDFRKGKVHDVEQLLERMNAAWPADGGARWCVLTGGEPLLQVDEALVEALEQDGWRVAVETNGTVAPAPRVFARLSHVCVSPKLGTELVLREAHELKVVLPGAAADDPSAGWTDEMLAALESAGTWGALYVQPLDPLVDGQGLEFTALRLPGSSADVEEEAASLANALYVHNLQRAVAFVFAHPQWRLSAQLHKFIQVP